MATRINPPQTVRQEPMSYLPTKTTKHATRKNRTRHFSPKTQIKAKAEEKAMNSLKVSLRDECLRLASFLKQETHRPGFVR